MMVEDSFDVRIANNPDKVKLKHLLEQNNLPVDDIETLDLQHFFGAQSTDRLLGVAGMEPYGSDALVRSLSVRADAQGQGIATALLKHLEQHAVSLGVQQTYLLTETADRFFIRHGYTIVPRATAPAGIQQSSQFSVLCPASAKFMHKALAS